jgi:hypothetical protein
MPIVSKSVPHEEELADLYRFWFETGTDEEDFAVLC